MSRRYIAVLAVAAVLTLAAGLLVRDRLLRAEASPPTAAPSEASALQQLSQEGQLRRLSSFLSERVSVVAALVEYVPSSQATGIRWGGRDSLVTTFADRPVVAVHVPRGDTTRPPSVAPSDSMRGNWALVVARAPDGNVVSAAGIVGGQLSTQCAGHAVPEYVLGVALPDGFAGAGVFDLDGRVMGMVARCGDRLVAVPMSDLAELMVDDSLGRRVRARYGFAARPLDETARAYFGTDSGLLVTDVRRQSPADRAGWMPGDVIRTVDGAGLGTGENARLLDSFVADTHSVVLRRGGETRATTLFSSATESATSADRSGTGIELANPQSQSGILIGAVRQGSPADVAGLRAGDRLLRVNNVVVRNAAGARGLLDRVRLGDRAALIVFERDSVVHAVLLRR